MRSFAITLALAMLVGPAAADASPDEALARRAALAFAAGLQSGDSSQLRPLLPGHGKVRLRLERLGPERGSYGATQVEAIFRDSLKRATVESFEIERLQCAPEGQFALIDGRARLLDRAGRQSVIEFHLTLQPEESRWVLREIRESER